jgi:hypothetical protein
MVRVSHDWVLSTRPVQVFLSFPRLTLTKASTLSTRPTAAAYLTTFFNNCPPHIPEDFSDDPQTQESTVAHAKHLTHIYIACPRLVTSRVSPSPVARSYSANHP